jgi:hypothetical protein
MVVVSLISFRSRGAAPEPSYVCYRGSVRSPRSAVCKELLSSPFQGARCAPRTPCPSCVSAVGLLFITSRGKCGKGGVSFGSHRSKCSLCVCVSLRRKGGYACACNCSVVPFLLCVCRLGFAPASACGLSFCALIPFKSRVALPELCIGPFSAVAGPRGLPGPFLPIPY